ncbi:Calx-beta domain-containing protein [Leifsonia sp. LS1]|uniref:Calx-beta domain-containing protein n=1 Tax=Leifsonia sp. LS1 TaxID=2828483 RepID=UPI001CFE3CA5|nr:Calx-beta domain-containing protein [Leifsonia sp. LS1]
MTRSSAHLRVACGVGVAVLALLLGAAPAALAEPAASAPAADGAIVPVVDCVQDAPLGAVVSRTVVLGYRSTADRPVTIPAGGGQNDLTSGAPDRGQPSTFLPGEHHGVALLTIDAQSEPTVGWRVRDAVAPIDAAAPACTAATAVTLSAPATVEPGRAVVVTAAVTRLLLGPADGGAVAFSLDDGDETVIPVAGGSARATLVAPPAGVHTLTARYVPAEGSALRPSSASTALASASAVGPLTVAANSVVAGSTSAIVVVSRGSAAGEATVDYTTADGTARAGLDYAAASGTVVLADGMREATVRIPLPARVAGAPAVSFFVLLQRASTTVSTASAVVLLPAVPAAPALAVADQPGGSSGASGARPATGDRGGPASALPLADPTARVDGGAGQDLLLLIVGALLTAGGIVGVVSVIRGMTMERARA